MNTIKKKLNKLSRNKIYKICQKMKVKCQTNDNKKKMISKYAILRSKLGEPGAYIRISESILKRTRSTK